MRAVEDNPFLPKDPPGDQSGIQPRPPLPQEGKSVFVPAKQATDSTEELIKTIKADKAAKDALTVEAARPLHCLIAWRIAREIGRLRLQLSSGDLLSRGDAWADLTYADEDSYFEAAPKRPTREQRMDRTFMEVIWSDPELYRPTPPAPKEGVKAEDDTDLAKWLSFARALAKKLLIFRKYHEANNLEALFIPDLNRMLWPSLDEILATEETHILAQVDILKNSGGLNLHMDLIDQGYTEAEARDLGVLSREYIKKRSSSDTEMNRFLMVHRLEAALEHVVDPKLKLAYLKALSQVQSLTRTDPTNLDEMFGDALDLLADDDDNTRLIEVTPE